MSRAIPEVLRHVCDDLAPFLGVLASAELPDAYLAAGMVRNRVWQRLFGGELPDTDWDVAFVGSVSSQEATARLNALHPGPWEAVNQQDYGHTTVAEALASWPETATAVGVRQIPDGLEVLAPWGFEDLLGGVIRRSPRFLDEAAYAVRWNKKRWPDRLANLRDAPWRPGEPDFTPGWSGDLRDPPDSGE